MPASLDQGANWFERQRQTRAVYEANRIFNRTTANRCSREDYENCTHAKLHTFRTIDSAFSDTRCDTSCQSRPTPIVNTLHRALSRNDYRRYALETTPSQEDL